MPVYCVSYDLRKPERNYDELYERLRAYGTYSHILESTWFIVTDDTANQVRDNLMEAVDGDDQFIVIEVVKHWGSFNLRKSTVDWLKRNL